MKPSKLMHIASVVGAGRSRIIVTAVLGGAENTVFGLSNMGAFAWAPHSCT